MLEECELVYDDVKENMEKSIVSAALNMLSSIRQEQNLRFWSSACRLFLYFWQDEIVEKVLSKS